MPRSLLHAERLGVTSALDAERLAATADLRGERQSVLDALRDQEVATVSDMRATSEKEIQTLHTEGRDLIDHLFLRALELMLLALLLSSLSLWVLLRSVPKPRAQHEKVLDRAA